MITAHKYLNLDVCIIHVSALIIQELLPNKKVRYDALLAKIISNLGTEANAVYPYALNFLFALDKIKYQIIDDTFQLKQ
jgi:hypothetical protein